MDDNEKRIREKLLFFYQEQIEIHVERKDREFWNGILIKPKNDDVWIMQEKKLGEVFLFICDIFDVDEYRQEVGKNG